MNVLMDFNKLNIPLIPFNLSNLSVPDFNTSVSICNLAIFVKKSSIFLTELSFSFSLIDSASATPSELDSFSIFASCSSNISFRFCKPLAVFTVPIILPIFISFKKAC